LRNYTGVFTPVFRGFLKTYFGGERKHFWRRQEKHFLEGWCVNIEHLGEQILGRLFWGHKGAIRGLYIKIPGGVIRIFGEAIYFFPGGYRACWELMKKRIFFPPWWGESFP